MFATGMGNGMMESSALRISPYAKAKLWKHNIWSLGRSTRFNLNMKRMVYS
jgi:hypothetical protein